MIKWPSVMYVKPGTTNTAWTFLTMFLMSPGSVNHVPQCETLPSILLYIVYPGVATCIDYQSILSLLCFSLWDMISHLSLVYTCTCITAYCVVDIMPRGSPVHLPPRGVTWDRSYMCIEMP